MSVALIAATPVIAPGNVLTVGSARRVFLTNAAIIFTLKREIPGVIPVRPQGGNVVRANAVSPTFEAGNVWFPRPQCAPWISEWQRELMDFPLGRHDDRVDSCSQCLHWLRKRDPVANRNRINVVAPVSIDRQNPFNFGQTSGSIWDVVDGNRPDSLPGMGSRWNSLYNLAHSTYM
jgi:hypothetical protein